MITVRLSKTLTFSGGVMNLCVDESFERGSFNGVCGVSGAGKTTLLKCIAGIARPDEGEISLNGRILFSSSCKINLHSSKRRVGYLFQDYSLFPNMTLRQNILYGCADAGLVDEYIRYADLSGLADHYPKNLSGGQQQRCALLRSALNNPEVLLLDEPFSALDGASRENLIALVAKLHRDFGFTVLMVSHTHGDIFTLSSRVMEISNGRVVRDKSRDDFYLSGEMSNKFSFGGTVLEIRKCDTVFAAYISAGNSICQVVISQHDAESLSAGDSVVIASKAFNPVVRKVVT